MSDTKNTWLLEGYTRFGQQGMPGLKVETLSRLAGISKSSFYHHFADMEGYVEQLLAYHVQQSRIIAEKERRAQSIDPDLINILLEHRDDLLFHRQLRFDPGNERFRKALVLANQAIGMDFIQLWAKELPGGLSQAQLAGIFELAMENFYLQINPGNLHAAWLRQYFERLKVIIRQFG
jgi:AcrR family transcriptional regulator